MQGRQAWPPRRHASSDPLLLLHEQMAASMNATARLLGVSHRVHISSADAMEADAPVPARVAISPQKHAKRALRYMSDAEIAAYVNEIAATLEFEGSSMMPGVEALVYGHCVKIVLSLVHEALDALPAVGILGLRLDVAPQKRRGLDLVEALRRRRDEDDARREAQHARRRHEGEHTEAEVARHGQRELAAGAEPRGRRAREPRYVTTLKDYPRPKPSPAKSWL